MSKSIPRAGPLVSVNISDMCGCVSPRYDTGCMQFTAVIQNPSKVIVSGEESFLNVLSGKVI